MAAPGAAAPPPQPPPRPIWWLQLKAYVAILLVFGLAMVTLILPQQLKSIRGKIKKGHVSGLPPDFIPYEMINLFLPLGITQFIFGLGVRFLIVAGVYERVMQVISRVLGFGFKPLTAILLFKLGMEALVDANLVSYYAASTTVFVILLVYLLGERRQVHLVSLFVLCFSGAAVMKIVFLSGGILAKERPETAVIPAAVTAGFALVSMVFQEDRLMINAFDGPRRCRDF